MGRTNEMAMTAEDLEQEFASRATPDSGGLILLQVDDALALVLRAEEERIPVLGVDCFIVSQHQTEAPLDHIADYSDAVSAGRGTWSAARRFIEKRRNTGLVFEVTLG